MNAEPDVNQNENAPACTTTRAHRGGQRLLSSTSEAALCQAQREQLTAELCHREEAARLQQTPCAGPAGLGHDAHKVTLLQHSPGSPSGEARKGWSLCEAQ